MSTLCITVTSYIPPSGDCVLLWRLLHETRRLTVVVPLIIINYIDIWAAPGHVGETHQVCLHQISPGYWAWNFYWLFHKYNLWIWDYELWNWVSLKTMQILYNVDKKLVKNLRKRYIDKKTVKIVLNIKLHFSFYVHLINSDWSNWSKLL